MSILAYSHLDVEEGGWLICFVFFLVSCDCYVSLSRCAMGLSASRICCLSIVCCLRMAVCESCDAVDWSVIVAFPVHTDLLGSGVYGRV